MGFDNTQNSIMWMAVDRQGDVVYGLSGGTAFRRARDGRVEALPTVGFSGYQGSGGAHDAAGRLWVVRGNETVVRRADADVAGWSVVAGAQSSPGVGDGAGAAARFGKPVGVAIGPGGEVLVTDAGTHTLRRLDEGSSGDWTVRTAAGLPPQDVFREGDGAQARFRFISALVADPDGHAVVGDSSSGVLRRVRRSGQVETIAGMPGETRRSVDGQGSAARFQSLGAMAFGADRTLWVATFDDTLRTVSADGVVRTEVIGQALSGEAGLAADGAGGLYIAEVVQGLLSCGGGLTSFDVWQRSSDRRLTRLFASDDVAHPVLVDAARRNFAPRDLAAGADGDLFFSLGHAVLRRRASGSIDIVAGAVASSGSADGPAGQARFNGPRGLAVDAAGNVFVADFANHTVRRIAVDGTVSTVMGRAGQPGVVLGPAPAGLQYPLHVQVVPGGLWISTPLAILFASM